MKVPLETGGPERHLQIDAVGAGMRATAGHDALAAIAIDVPGRQARAATTSRARLAACRAISAHSPV